MGLKLRLILFSISVLLMLWLAAVAATSFTARGVVNDLIDQQLWRDMRISAQSYDMYRTAEVKPTLTVDKINWNYGDERRRMGFVVWVGDDRPQQMSSIEAPPFPRPTKSGYSTVQIEDAEGTSSWRLLSEEVDDNVWFSIGTDLGRARQQVFDLALQAFYPLVLIIPLFAIGVSYAINLGMRPMNVLARLVRNRSPNSLEPVDKKDVPGEVAPMLNALNDLLWRLRQMMEHEHRFTANAAHELQTPLAAIKAEVEACQLRSPDSATNEMLQGISERVDRAIHTVRQLLMLARLEPGKPLVSLQPVDLQGVLQNCMADLGHIAMERQLRIRFEETEVGPVQGDEDLLTVMVRNLLENALRYTPTEGRIEASVRATDKGVALAVANDCPPVPEQERRQLMESFYRRPGSGGPGAGLGLSIVVRISELHRCDFRLEQWHDEGGLAIIIRFPA